MLLADLVPPVAVKLMRRALRRPEINPTPDGVGQFAPGHFYSPIPSPDDVTARLEFSRAKTPQFPDIQFNEQLQFRLLERFAGFYGELPFPHDKSPDCRYYYDQSVFCYPDAIFLYCFLRHIQPARIIEVGSGFSSGVMLDTVERFFPTRPHMTFIEPYPDRLNQILRDEDRDRVAVIADKVQNTSADLFTTLQAGDLLFIDSSHVVKCGSDVQFLLFEVLPRLAAGVYVHFHDVLYSFEYPEEWLRRGWYWNEAYFLRAFLAFNHEWSIHFFNNYVVTHFHDFLSQHMPLCVKDIGGSLYLQRRA